MLLERDEPLSLLQGAFARACAGRGHSVFVAGEAGIGKTSLVEAFAQAQSAHARVLWGACDALSTPRPLGPLYDMAHAVGEKLVAALDAGLPLHRVFQAFVADLSAAQGATIVVVEDAHWADDASADFVKFVGRRIARQSALLVVTFREDEVGAEHPLIRAIGDVPADHSSRVRLCGLSAHAVARLAAAHAREIPNLHSITDGNPLLVTELLRGPDDAVSASLRDTMLARLQRLSPAARELAELVSVVPDRTELELLDWILPAHVHVLPECVALRTLVLDRGQVRYRHELGRRVIEQSLPEASRRALHARVLEALARNASPGMLSRLVHHADAAGDGVNVLQYAPRAAEEASRRGAHRQSAELCRRALRHAADLGPRDRALLLEKLAAECALSGRGDEALAANACAAEVWRETGDTFAQGANRRARFELLHLGLFRRGEAEFTELAEAAVSLLGPHGASGELAKAYMNHAFVLSMDGRLDEAQARHDEAVATAQSAADRAALSQVLLQGELRKHSFFREPSFEPAERALALALEDDDDQRAAHAYFCLAMFALNVVRLGYAERILDAGLRFADERDLDGHKLPLLALQARTGFARGDWARAEAIVTGLLAKPDLPGIAEFNALLVLGQCLGRRGDPLGRRHLERALELATGKIGSRLSKLHSLVRLAELHWLASDASTALEFARRGVIEAAFMQAYPWMRGQASFWLWRISGVAPNRDPPGTPYALQIDGDWAQAAAAWEHLGCPYERALALIDGDAAAQREALRVLDRLGAAAAVKRCRELLAGRGVTHVPRGPRPSTRANPMGLTERETEVLALLGEGLQNNAIGGRLHRSGKTVAHHVAAILAKLGAGSRQEAVRIARANGLLGPPR